MDFWATKTPYERQQEEDERLVRPNPKDKPPRRDLRREHVRSEDDGDGRDPSDQKDRSKNFKDVGGSLVERVAARAAERIPAKSRETGEVVSISPETLKEQPGKYEAVDEEESEEEGPPTDREKYYQTAGKALRALAKTNPSLDSKLKAFANPQSDIAGIAKENPSLPVSRFFPGVELPKELKTLGDVLEALSKSSKADKKPKSKKPKEEPAPEPEPSTIQEEEEKPQAPPEEAPKAKPEKPPKPKKEPKPSEDEAKPEEGEKAQEPTQEPTENEKAGVPLPKRRAVNLAEREEAVSLIVSTFPPHVAATLIAKNMHPDDASNLVRDYTAAKASTASKDLNEIVAQTSSFFQTDPAKVPPPKQGLNAAGERVPFESLTPDEQAETLARHQVRVAALSMAAQDVLTSKFRLKGRLTNKPRIPESVASTLANVVLSRPSKENAEAIGAQVFDSVLQGGTPYPLSDKVAKELLGTVGKVSPETSVVVRSFLQANDYSLAKQRFLKGDEETLSEWQSPKDLLRGMAKAGQFFDQRNAVYGVDGATHPSSTLFRSRVMSRLRALDPKKAQVVQAQLPRLEEREYQQRYRRWQARHKAWQDRKRDSQAFEPEPLEPKPPASKASKPGEDLWQATFEQTGTKKTGAFTYSSAQVMGSVNRIGIYHGVDPYAYGPAAYPGWLQPHQRDLGDADFEVLTNMAESWLSSDLLSLAVEGMPADARERAALDLAIYDSPYNGAINARQYNQLLSRLGVKTASKEASYRTETRYLVVWGPKPVERSVLAAIEAERFAFKDELGVERDFGQITAKVIRLASPLTDKQAGEGLSLESVIRVDFPEGSEASALQSLRKALSSAGFSADKTTPGYLPTFRTKEASDASSFSLDNNSTARGTPPMKASLEIRKFAAQLGASNSKLAFEMLAFADRLAEEEKKLPPWLKDKDEKKDEGEKKEASNKLAGLRSLIIKQAAAVDAQNRAPWLPVLQALKDLG